MRDLITAESWRETFAGVLLGTAAGDALGLPAERLGSICDWPRSVGLLNRVSMTLGRQKTTGTPCGPACYFWPGLLRLFSRL
jgi:hypothetical protein